MKRTPLRRVSIKRAKELREYSKLREAYLVAHPYCQVAIKINGLDEAKVIENCGHDGYGGIVRLATEIHHVGKRYGSRLNDTSKWLAVSRLMHLRIEQDKTWARANGLLDNF